MARGKVELHLAGRQDELEALLGFMGEAMRANGQLTLISGEAGIGKTTLVEAAKEWMKDLDPIILVGRCLPGIASPYLPFAEAFKKINFKRPIKREFKLSTDSSEAEAASCDSIFEEEESDKIYFDVLRALKENSIRKPVLVELEDLHWSDSASIQLLHFLARNLKGVRILIIGTYRAEDLKAGPRHPFLESLRIMRREGVLNEIDLKALGGDDISLAVTRLLGGKVDRQLLERIYKESNGNPLYATEIVKLLTGNGSISFRDGAWKATKPGALEIPSTVNDVILRRLDRLTRSERRIIDCASIIGETFEADLIQGTLGIDRLILLDELQSLESDQQIIVSDDPRFRFAHEKIRRVAYDEISSPRKIEMHRSIGLQLEKRLPQEKRYGELSYHYYNSLNKEKCAKYSVIAGDEVIDHGGSIEAVQYYNRALETLPDSKEFTDTRLHAMEMLGTAYREQGDFSSAVQKFEEILTLQIPGRDRARLLRKLGELNDPIRLGRGDKTKMMELFDQALAMPEIDDDTRGEIASVMKVTALFEGNLEEAKRQGELAVDAFRRTGDNKKLALELLYDSDTNISIGDLETALKMVKEAEELNSNVCWVEVSSEIAFHFGQLYFHQGKVKKSLEYFMRYRDVSEKLGRLSAVSIVDFCGAMLLEMSGDSQGALKLAERSLDIADMLEHDYLRAGALAALAHISYNMRRLDDCRKYANKAYEIGGKFGKGMKSNVAGMVFLAKADAALTRNDWSAANDLFMQAIAQFEGCPVGLYFDGLSHALLADALFMQERIEEAKSQLVQALAVFEKLGNELQSERCRRALAALPI